MSTDNFLFELGTEELPPKSLLSLSNALEANIVKSLADLGLAHANVKSFATPRRLAVVIEGLELQQADRQESRRGPSVKAPEQAIQGFARSCGVSPEELSVLDTDKGQYYEFDRKVEGEKTTSLIAGVVTTALLALPIAKRMRWGASREEFVRPVQWFIMMLGEKLVDTELFGLQNGQTTRGHRFHGTGDFEINSALSYSSQLLSEGHVIADFNERKELIRAQIQEQALAVSANAIVDEKLLDEVTALVEYPVCLTGRFDERFLELPAQALVSSMKEHQKYFHFEDNNGQILPLFLTVSNIISKDASQIISGNERVIRPRLADAAFFFETDKKSRLESRNEGLGKVVFQAKLGTLLSKTQRISTLASRIATLCGADAALAARAGILCKADLNTEMVLEFGDLQGLMGHVYALNDGEDPQVAKALEQHYWPKFAGDLLPETSIASCVALADRLDTLVGLFGIGQPPTGSKDPYALRRATVGLVRIIIEQGLELDLADLIAAAYKLHADLPQPLEEVEPKLLAFVFDRLRAYYDDQDIPVEVYLSVMENKSGSLFDFDKRMKAVTQFTGLESADSLSASNKRVSNIIAKNGVGTSALDSSVFVDAAEVGLYETLMVVRKDNGKALADGDYQAALTSMLALSDPLDRFFTEVMVMTDDESVKNNRLALLSEVRTELGRIADISLLSS